MEDIILAIITAFLGVLFGLISVAVGIGGGLLNVPYFIFVVELGSTATLTSSFVIFFTSLSGAIRYRMQNRIDIKTGLIYLGIAIPGILLGSYLAQRVITDVRIIKLLFAILIGFAAVRNLLKIYRGTHGGAKENEQRPEHEESLFYQHRRIVAKNGDVFDYYVKLGIGSLGALIGGFLAGLLGVGGGIIFVPLLTSISGLPMHIAAATSSFMIVFVTIIVLIIRFSLFDGSLATVFYWGISLAVGTVIGASIGASKTKKIKSHKLLTFFWIIAILSALRMGYGAL